MRRLEELDSRLGELDVEVRALAGEREALVAEIRQSFMPPPPPSGPASTSAGTLPPPPGLVSPPELHPANLGVLLLWIGVALLAIAGLIFAIVAWPELSDWARAALLAAGTLLAGCVAFALRSRLPRTSESLAVIGSVTVVVLAVDTIWPVAAQLPRWMVIGAAGLLFVWLGATFEHRRSDLSRLGDLLDRMR